MTSKLHLLSRPLCITLHYKCTEEDARFVVLFSFLNDPSVQSSEVAFWVKMYDFVFHLALISSFLTCVCEKLLSNHYSILVGCPYNNNPQKAQMSFSSCHFLQGMC